LQDRLFCNHINSFKYLTSSSHHANFLVDIQLSNSGT